MKKISKFLKISLIMLSSLIPTCQIISTKPTKELTQSTENNKLNTTKANKFLRQFPEKLPGIKKVEKYETPNAEICLIHIKSPHFAYNQEIFDIIQSEIPEKRLFLRHIKQAYSYVNNVQRNLFLSLSYLIKHHNLTEIWTEGVSTKTTKKDIFRYHSAVIDFVLDTGCFNQEILQRDSGSFIYIPGAEVCLNITGKLKLLPTEISEQASETRQNDRDLEWVYDERENICLRLISNSGSQSYFHYITFGGRHAFGGRHSCGRNYSLENRISFQDNLFNPEFRGRFSLIELTPEGYIENYGNK